MSKQKDRNSKFRNTGIFSLFTGLSRIIGLVRDVLKANAFGTGFMAVAFDVAFRIPNMLRNLVAEGALSHAFIPLYEEHKGKVSEREFSGIILGFLFIFLLVMITILWLLIPTILPYLMNDTSSLLPQTVLAIDLAQVLLPYIVILSLSSIFMGIQYSHNIFWAASFGPALLNIVTVGLFGLFLLSEKFDLIQVKNQVTNVYVFSLVTLVAALSQLVFQFWVVKKRGLTPKFKIVIKHKYLKGLFVLMLPAVFGAGVQQIGQLIDTFLATSIKEVPGAVSALNYSHRLIQLPMGIFGVAIATASLPQLSKLYKERDDVGFSDSITNSINVNLFFLLPSIIGLILLAQPIVGLLFESGKFDKNSTIITSSAVQYYSLGILGFSLQKLFMTAFYAQKNSKLPAIITFIVLTLNISLSVFFMRYIQHNGLALGSALSAYLGVFIYLVFLIKKKQINFLKDFWLDFGKIILVNIILFFICYFTLYAIGKSNLHDSYLMKVFLLVPVAAVSYFLLSTWFKVAELQMLKKLIMRNK